MKPKTFISTTSLPFSSQEELMSFLAERDARLTWMEVDMPASNLVVFNKLPMAIDETDIAKFVDTADVAKIEKVAETHNVTISIDGKLHLVNENAFDSLLERFGENSPMNKFLLSKHNKTSDDFESEISGWDGTSDNYVLDTINKNKELANLATKSQALYLDGEFVAFNGPNYKAIPQVEIFEKTISYFDAYKPVLHGASYETNHTVAVYELTGLEDKVNDDFDLPVRVTPYLKVETSDTGRKSVTLTPLFGIKSGALTLFFKLSNAKYLIHSGDSSIEVFNDLLKEVFVKSTTSFEDVKHAQQTKLNDITVIKERLLSKLDILSKAEMEIIENELTGLSLICCTSFDILRTVRENLMTESDVKIAKVEELLFKYLINKETRIF